MIDPRWTNERDERITEGFTRYESWEDICDAVNAMPGRIVTKHTCRHRAYQVLKLARPINHKRRSSNADRWTDARRAMIIEQHGLGMPWHMITEMCNALPGVEVRSEQVRTFAISTLRLKRIARYTDPSEIKAKKERRPLPPVVDEHGMLIPSSVIVRSHIQHINRASVRWSDVVKWANKNQIFERHPGALLRAVNHKRRAYEVPAFAVIDPQSAAKWYKHFI